MELFARHSRDGWTQWGDELESDAFVTGADAPGMETEVSTRLLEGAERYHSNVTEDGIVG